jgi:hypothetical protein
MTKDFRVPEKCNFHLQGYYSLGSEELIYLSGSGPSVNDEGEEDMEKLGGIQIWWKFDPIRPQLTVTDHCEIYIRASKPLPKNYRRRW